MDRTGAVDMAYIDWKYKTGCAAAGRHRTRPA
jgi:hypothetical protein